MEQQQQAFHRRLEQLEQDYRDVRDENRALRARLAQLETGSRTERRRLRIQAGLAFIALVVAILASPAPRAALAQGYGTTLQQLLTRVIALEQKTQYVSVAGGEMYVTGTNLHIVNGLGATNGYPTDPSASAPGLVHVNGKGNLIIGYNATGSFNGDVRTGSHNLIVGDYLNYSSYGAIVAGWNNTSTSRYASTLGGRSNQAAAEWTTIVGGAFNVADGSTASILGGNANHAGNVDASVCGGSGNAALGRFSVGGGGAGRSASGDYNWADGGYAQSF